MTCFGVFAYLGYRGVRNVGGKGEERGPKGDVEGRERYERGRGEVENYVCMDVCMSLLHYFPLAGQVRATVCSTKNYRDS